MSLGFKRVSDYEEEESLRRALQESASSSLPVTTPAPTSVGIAVEYPIDPPSLEEFEDDLPEVDLSSRADASTTSTAAALEKLSIGSRWWQMPSEIVDDIVRYLGDVDMLGYLRMLSKTPVFCASEKVYKEFCQRIYFAQTGNIVAESAYLRFHSWRNMLIHRPRIRTNGIYSVDVNYFMMMMMMTFRHCFSYERCTRKLHVTIDFGKTKSMNTLR